MAETPSTVGWKLMSANRKGARTAIKFVVDRMDIARNTMRYAKRISITAADVEMSVENAYEERA